MNDQDLIQEFLLESAENLAQLDQDMVRLEQEPANAELLASVFRTIHTIKGTCGFLGFDRLQALAHVTEDILAQLRSGERTLDGPLTTVVLEAVDAIKRILGAIQSGGTEGEVFETELIARLKRSRSLDAAPPQEPPREAPQGAASPAPPPPPQTTASESTLRVDVGLLDRLMNLAGELVLTRNQLSRLNASRDDAALNAVSQRLNLITTELQESVMKTRMQPIGVVWHKLPRVVRDLAASLGKQITLEMEGSDTELDRALIDAIKDPLTHIVRNSCDHGIETPGEREAGGKSPQGRLMLRAWHEGGQVNIEIADDGKGIDVRRVKEKALERRLITEEQAARLSDREAVNLVFQPGFSTAQSVTNISGRGVGMDVVRTHVERVGGAVELTSRPGRGASVRVRIPLTLAIMPGLVVRAGGERFVIPQLNLDELIQLGEGDRGIEFVHDTPVLRRRNALLPLVDLCGVLGIESRRAAGEASIVVLQTGGARFALAVDAICDTEEIVVKPLGQQLKPLTCYAGATVMGDGRIALILDVAGLAARAGVAVESAGKREAQPAAATDAAGPRTVRLVLFRAGTFERVAAPLDRVARLEKIDVRRLERAGGRPVAQYRSRILPLLHLGEFLGGGGAWDETLQVIVIRNGGSEFGIVVDEITDVVDSAVTDARGADLPGLAGAATIDGRITDLLDVDCAARAVAWADPGALVSLSGALAGFDAVLTAGEAFR